MLIYVICVIAYSIIRSVYIDCCQHRQSVTYSYYLYMSYMNNPLTFSTFPVLLIIFLVMLLVILLFPVCFLLKYCSIKNILTFVLNVLLLPTVIIMYLFIVLCFSYMVMMPVNSWIIFTEGIFIHKIQ